MSAPGKMFESPPPNDSYGITSASPIPHRPHHPLGIQLSVVADVSAWGLGLRRVLYPRWGGLVKTSDEQKQPLLKMAENI